MSRTPINAPREQRPAEPVARLLALVWLAAAIAFVLLSYYVATHPVSSLNLRLTLRAHAHAGFLAPLLRLDNLLGDPAPFALVLFAATSLLLLRRRWPEALLVASAVVPAGLAEVLKQVIRVPAPFLSPKHALAAQRYAFPSGHVVAVAVLFVLLIVVAPRLLPGVLLSRLLQAACIVIVATIGLARVWSYAHWPSDAIGGYLFALLFLIPMIALYQRLTPAPTDRP